MSYTKYRLSRGEREGSLHQVLTDDPVDGAVFQRGSRDDRLLLMGKTGEIELGLPDLDALQAAAGSGFLDMEHGRVVEAGII